MKPTPTCLPVPSLIAVALLGAILGTGTAHAHDLDKGSWIDLTHPFNEESVYWPTAKSFKKTEVFQGHTEGGWYYTAFDYEAAEHGGTHIDSPIHFAEGKHTTEQIPVEQLVGPGVVIDVSARSLEDRDYEISVDDVTGWESRHGRIPVGAIVLFNTGSAQFYPDRVRYMGTEERGPEAVAKLHFPGLHPDTARLLIERRIKAVGLDTPSIDPGQSKDFLSHRILFEENIPGFENVAHLDRVPPTGTTIVALPMKIEGGSGGPLRIVAFLPKP